MSQNHLLTEIEIFLNASGMNPTMLGKLAMNDPMFVFDLRNGRDYRRSTEERIRTFMKKYKPSSDRH